MFPLLKKKAFYLLFILTLPTAAQNTFDVLNSKWLLYSDAQNSLYHDICRQAFTLLDERNEKIAGISSLDGWQQRQKEIRKTLDYLVGPFPEKTPLNATIVKTIRKKDFRIEHIIFESQPRFYVTSSLYIPENVRRNAKLPAIIYCSGHSADGYRSAVYQHVILNLVARGFIVFAFDPVGQGERLEYYDPVTGKSTVGGPTSEHSYPGAQAFMAGSSQARYMIWDGIRAVDYLVSRKEVDSKRIGITGRSGGGTQSAYIAAFDDRIYAAAPENYITNYTRLLQTIGPQDAEQNIAGLIKAGLDHPDFLIVRAPKPALMITTTGDMFSIQGARETETEVARAYHAFGSDKNFSRAEDDAGHASTLKNREALYAFFSEHLNNPGDTKDVETEQLTREELQVTTTGQVSTSLGGETVFSLNLKEAIRHSELLNEMRKEREAFYENVPEHAKTLSGYIDPVTIDDPVFTGRIVNEGYSVEKYFIKGEGGCVIPFLLFKPDRPSQRTMIYLHPSGKAAQAGKGGEIENFVMQGFTILAPDLPGIGELGPGSLRGDAYFKGVSHNLWYTSILIGRSITGIQAGEVTRLAKTLRKYFNASSVTGYSGKELAPVLLHSSALGRCFDNIILPERFVSYFSLVSNRNYDPVEAMHGVYGALKHYDLDDLARSPEP